MIARHLSANSAKKSSFGRLVHYISDDQSKAARIGSMRAANCYSDEIEDVIAEVTNTQQMNKRAVSAKNYHLLISFRKEDALSNDVIQAIEGKICASLGFAEHQRFSVVHQDTDNMHIHVAINKIHPRRHTIHTPKGDYHTLLKVSAELEKEYGLSPDNHQIKNRGTQSSAFDMENKAGLQSLLGWIQKNCLPQLKQAKNWKSVHDILSVNGLELRERGNGFAFVSKDGLAVKASAVDRSLSKSNLVKQFGEFIRVDGASRASHSSARQYRKKPINSHPNSEKLYAQYTSEQTKIRSQREILLSQAKQKKEKLIVGIKRQSKLKRILIRHSHSGIAMKLMYLAIYQSQGKQIKQASNDYLVERKSIYAQHAQTGWKQWLKANSSRSEKLNRTRNVI